MKNQTHPMQPRIKSKQMTPFKETTFRLSMNEFVDENNQIGIFMNDPEPYQFFSVEDLFTEKDAEDGYIFQTKHVLSDISYAYER